MTRYAGIDFDTHAIDVVTLCNEDDDALHDRVSIEPKDALPTWRAYDAARQVRAAVASLDWQGVKLAVIERPAGRGDSIHKLMRIQGAIIASLPISVVSSWEVWPVEIKLAFCGSGKATKEDIVARAIERGFRPPADPALAEHACDAFAICWVARDLNRLGVMRAEAVA